MILSENLFLNISPIFQHIPNNFGRERERMRIKNWHRLSLSEYSDVNVIVITLYQKIYSEILNSSAVRIFIIDSCGPLPKAIKV